MFGLIDETHRRVSITKFGELLKDPQRHGADIVSDYRAGPFIPLCTNPAGEDRASPKRAIMEVYSGLDAWIHHKGPPRVVLPGPDGVHRIPLEESPVLWENPVSASPRLRLFW